MGKKDPAEKVVRDIRRKTRRRHSTEEKIRIILEGLRGEESIAVLCRREGIAESLYPGFPRWIASLMTFLGGSAIRINAIPSSRRVKPVSPCG